jgi:Two component regulator propeller
MTEDREGRIWIAGAGLVALAGEHSVVYYTGRRNEFFRPVLEAPNGSILAGSIVGLERLDPGAARLHLTELRNCAVKTLMLDSAHNLWVGTTGGLILDYDGQRTVFSSPDTLPDNQVSAALEDSEHNLWFGTGNGLVRWSPTPVSVVKTMAKPSDDNIRTVYRASQGSIWVTAASGRIYELRNGQLAPAHLPRAVKRFPARTVFQDRAGRLDRHRWSGSIVPRSWKGNAIRKCERRTFEWLCNGVLRGSARGYLDRHRRRTRSILRYYAAEQISSVESGVRSRFPRLALCHDPRAFDRPYR